MIELYISSSIKIKRKIILQKLIEKGVECNITKNLSSVQNKCLDLEYGYYIKIFNVDEKTFIDKVWNQIQPLLKLECAYVKYSDKYMGCVMNWPNVFVKSKCKGDSV